MSVPVASPSCPGALVINHPPRGRTEEIRCQKDPGHPGRCKHKVLGTTYWWGLDSAVPGDS